MLRFGTFELDEGAGQLRKDGVPVRLPPQPFRLLALLASRPGELISRDEIRQQLWGEDTYVDFDQGVNFCIKQVRSVLRDDADRPLYVETVPKRGYRFIAPVERPGPVTPPPAGPKPSGMDSRLQRALWTNIAELRLAESRRRRRRIILLVAAIVLVAAGILFVILR